MQSMVIHGKIIKGIAGFYYVHVAGKGIYECKAKGVFRKNNEKPLVGDNVEIIILDEENKLGNVENIPCEFNQVLFFVRKIFKILFLSAFIYSIFEFSTKSTYSVFFFC